MHVCVVRALCMELNQFMQLGLMTFFSLLLSLTVFCIFSLPLPLFVRSSFGRSLHLFVIEDCWEEIASCCSIPFQNIYIHIILGNTSIYLSFIYILLLGMTGWAISVLDCPPEVSPSLLLLSFRSFFLPSSDWGKHVKLAIVTDWLAGWLAGRDISSFCFLKNVSYFHSRGNEGRNRKYIPPFLCSNSLEMS